jgi:hypothetical protein
VDSKTNDPEELEPVCWLGTYMELDEELDDPFEEPS